MVKSKDIIDMNHVSCILNYLQEYYMRLVELYSEEDFMFEHGYEKIEEQLLEIEEFIIDKEKITTSTIIEADLRMHYYWQYIMKKIKSFDSLLKKLKEYSKG